MHLRIQHDISTNKPCYLVLIYAAVIALMSILLTACGGGNNESSTSSPSPEATLTLVAGSDGGSGNIDDSNLASRFYVPSDVAVDSYGNNYIADFGNNTIRKISTSGAVTTLAGLAGYSGRADGVGSAARFSGPAGVAVDASGNVYVADGGNNVIRKVSPVGVVSTFAGSGVAGSADGVAMSASFNIPSGVAVDNAGNVYVADSRNFTIRKITQAGVVTTLAGTAGVRGSADGTGAAASFGENSDFFSAGLGPAALAVDNNGNVYVADTFNATVRKITAAGVVSTLAGTAQKIGSLDGQGSQARFGAVVACNLFCLTLGPTGIAVDGSGNVFVFDGGNFTLRETSAGGLVTTIAGTAGVSGNVDGQGSAARFGLMAKSLYQQLVAQLQLPTFGDKTGLAFTPNGTIEIADFGNNELRLATTTGDVTTVAGQALQYGATDGVGGLASFNGPTGVALDATGNIYVADSTNNLIRKVTADGTVSTLAGSASQGPGYADGTGSSAIFNNPQGVAVDAGGNLYVADTGNCVIRKITTGGVVSTLAGKGGTCGAVDGTGASAGFSQPLGVAMGSNGVLYVADLGDVRQVTSTGVVTTLASEGYNPNKSGAYFAVAQAVAVDSAGTLYVLDSQGGRVLRESAPGDFVFLGGEAPILGPSPSGLAVDGAGNVFVTNTDDDNVLEITPAGQISTVIGQTGLVGTELGALPGSLDQPKGIAIGANGQMVLSSGNGIFAVTGKNITD